MGWLLVRQLGQFDFAIYWRSTHNFLLGLNPYELPHQTKYLYDLPFDIYAKSSPILKMWGPPIIFATTWPFALLELKLASSLFLLFYIATVCFSTIALFKLAFPATNHLPTLQLLIAAIIALPAGWLVHGLYWGSLTWICLLSITLALLALNTNHKFIAGLCLYGLLLKLQLFVLPLAAIAIVSYKKREFKFLAGFALALLIGFASVLIINPASFLYYLRTSGLDLPYLLITSTGTSLVRYIAAPTSNAALFLPVCILALTLVGFSRQVAKFSTSQLLVLLTPLSIYFGPYAWGHDYLVALPLNFVSAALFFQLRQHGRAALAACILSALLVSQAFLLFFAFTMPEHPAVFVAPATITTVLAILSGYAILSLTDAHIDTPLCSKECGLVNSSESL